MSDAEINSFADQWYAGNRDGLDAILAGMKPSDAVRIAVRLLTKGYMDMNPQKGARASEEFRKALADIEC